MAYDKTRSDIDRRSFFRTTGAGVTAAGFLFAGREAPAQELSERHKLDRLVSNSYPVRMLFKTRPRAAGAGRGGGGNAQTPPSPGGAPASRVPGRGMGDLTPEQMRKKYGEITMLDFPQFTKDTFTGVTHLDVWSSLFGDVTDDSMYADRGFDPSSPSGKKWLERFASTLVKTGTKVHHISNNAPNNISGPDDALRRAGIETAKKWLDGAAILGAQTMRVNTGGPSLLPEATRGPDGYPMNQGLAPYFKSCIDSFKEMADYGAERGVKVTIENHWGLTANPMNMRILLDAINHPFCEASPDYANWEHEYMLFSGLKAVAPYTHTTVHAKFWDRWSNNDVQRSTRILLASGYRGKFALEYESGPWDGVEGARYLMKEVMTALSGPVT
jgi:hypothetical protein